MPDKDDRDAIRDAATAQLRETILGAHLEKHALEQASITGSISEVQKRSDRDRIDHVDRHKADQTAIEAALDNEQRRLAEHQVTHQAAHNAHSEKHDADKEALDIALEAERHRLAAHREAHEAAHHAHEVLHEAFAATHKDQHASEHRAVEAAQASMDKRLDQMNEFRDQLRDQALTFARREVTDGLDSQLERRYEELRALIATEREERREALGTKKGAVDNRTSIYAAIAVVGTLLGILVVLVNFITAAPTIITP